ncbi:MAG: tetratricopeptide repeat protein [Deltaproteobacteria bacterium]|nr:tetratricopeptide repeat protein [Deltaproteobacteria bacterium]
MCARASLLALTLVLAPGLGGCQTDQERALELLAGPGAGGGASAREALSEATRLDPSLRAAWSRLAELELAESRWVEAEAAASRAITLSDTEARDHETRARARVALERWAEAEPDITREIELGAPEAPARTRLGKVQEHLDRADDAMASYRRAIELDDANVEARLALARILIGRLDAASESDTWEGDDALREEAHVLLRAASAPSQGTPFAEEAVALSNALEALDQRAAALAARRQVAEMGIIGLLAAGSATTSPFGDATALGNDTSALGALMGDSIGDNFGFGGLGLSGIGEGGGGGEGTIGLGNIGTIGHGAGTGAGQGYGSGAGRLGSSTTDPGATVRITATASGGLEEALVLRVARRATGQLRFCYEQALRSDPALAGTMAIEATVNASGTAERARASGLGDATLQTCMSQSIARAAFPPAAAATTVTVSVACTASP